MSANPAGGARRFDAWRMAGMVRGCVGAWRVLARLARNDIFLGGEGR